MNQRGVVLITCYLGIAALTILGTAFLMRSISERGVASKYFDSTQALWITEAGMQRSLWELNHNSCVGCVQCGGATPCADCACNQVDKCVSGTPGSFGNYSATINSSNDTITSTGSFPSVDPVSKTIHADLFFKSVFQYGIFSKNKILFENTASTDSYNSSKGDYNALLPGGGSNVGANGSVGTNSTEVGAIELDNSSKINGNAGIGVDGDLATGIDTDRDDAITGNRAADVDIDMPSVPEPITPAGGWSNLSGDNLSLNSGSYSASSLTLDNRNSTLDINGDVTLYITGDVNLQNFSSLNINPPNGKLTLYVNGKVEQEQTASINNVTKIPSNFSLFSRYSGLSDGVTFNNNTALYGTIYAPDAKVTLAQSFQLYGAVAGGSASLFNSTKVHYDEALANTPTPFATPTYDVRNWREWQNEDNQQSPF